MIDRLLHICNSEPYCFGSKDEFYALKSRLLERYGTPDGYDVQHILGNGQFAATLWNHSTYTTLRKVRLLQP